MQRNANDCDLAVLPPTITDAGSASDNNTRNDVVHSFQLSLPRFTFSGKDRKQHFFLDVVSTSSTEESKSDDEGETKVDASMNDTIVKKFTLKCDRRLYSRKVQPNKPTSSQSILASMLTWIKSDSSRSESFSPQVETLKNWTLVFRHIWTN